MPRYPLRRQIPLRNSGSAEIVADWSSQAYTSGGCNRANFYIVVSAVTDTPSVVPTLEAYDLSSNSWIAVAKGAAITATGTYVLTIGPGQNEVDDVDTAPVLSSVNGFLPNRWRLTMDGTWGGTDGMTFTARAELAA